MGSKGENGGNEGGGRREMKREGGNGGRGGSEGVGRS